MISINMFSMFLFIMFVDILLLMFDEDRARNSYNILACLVVLVIMFAAWRM